MIRRIIVLACCAVLAAPYAHAADDTTILLIENDAGMVTTNKGMTQRECDAVVALLSARIWSQSLATVGSTGFVGSVVTGTYWPGGGDARLPTASSSSLKSAKCVKPTEGAK